MPWSFTDKVRNSSSADCNSFVHFLRILLLFFLLELSRWDGPVDLPKQQVICGVLRNKRVVYAG